LDHLFVFQHLNNDWFKNCSFRTFHQSNLMALVPWPFCSILEDDREQSNIAWEAINLFWLLDNLNSVCLSWPLTLFFILFAAFHHLINDFHPRVSSTFSLFTPLSSLAFSFAASSSPGLSAMLFRFLFRSCRSLISSNL
jgi:hypothetical protein